MKPTREFFPVTDVPFTAVDPRVPGLTERVLARDEDSGLATRILAFAAGTDTSALGPQRHAFWEEVYVLSGSLTDLTLGETFHAGTYACRPPGMPHGPWVAPHGCLTFEVRYQSGPAR
jgi:quercetin dioxygenase-like cupin family protein